MTGQGIGDLRQKNKSEDLVIGFLLCRRLNGGLLLAVAIDTYANGLVESHVVG